MKSMAERAASSRFGRIALILAMVLGALGIALKLVIPDNYANSDFFSFWLAGRMALQGADPYSADLWVSAHRLYQATWVSDQTLIYPLPLSLVFVPLGMLPLYPAYVVWVALSILMIIASGALLLGQHPWSVARYYALPLLLGTAAFRPAILSLLNGQLTSLLLLILACVAYLWERGKWRLGGLLLPLLALKPNLGVPILVLLSLYLLLRKQFAAVLCEAAGGAGLIAIGLLQNPHWISEYAAIGSSKVALNFILSPTIWGVSASLCGLDLSCTIPIAALTVMLLVAGSIAFLIKSRAWLSPAWAAGLSAAVMLLSTPYTWQYDQLLLLVLMVEVTLSLAGSGLPFLPNALIFVGLDVFAFVLLWITGQTELAAWNTLIPVCVLGLAAWAISQARGKRLAVEPQPSAA